MEYVINLGKLIVLLFLFCLPLLSIFFENSENKRNDLARPVMGTIFLVMVKKAFRKVVEYDVELTMGVGMHSEMGGS